MKKLTSMLLVFVMIAAIFAGCANNTPANTEGTTTEPTTTAPTIVTPDSALNLLETVWALFAEDQKFPTMGGDMESATMDAPGSNKLGGEENTLYNLYVPDDQLANISEAATLFHAMNLNTFTTGALKLAEGVDAAAFAKTMRDTIMSTHWMCGFPERLIVANIGEYVIVAFGLDGVNNPESGKIITNFVTHLQEAYPDTAILFDEEIK